MYYIYCILLLAIGLGLASYGLKKFGISLALSYIILSFTIINIFNYFNYTILLFIVIIAILIYFFTKPLTYFVAWLFGIILICLPFFIIYSIAGVDKGSSLHSFTVWSSMAVSFITVIILRTHLKKIMIGVLSGFLFGIGLAGIISRQLFESGNILDALTLPGMIIFIGIIGGLLFQYYYVEKNTLVNSVKRFNKNNDNQLDETKSSNEIYDHENNKILGDISKIKENLSKRKFSNKKLLLYGGISLIVIILIFVSFGKSAEDIADETCKCFESILNKKIFTKEEMVFHIDSCTNVIELSYELFEKENEKLKKELFSYKMIMDKSEEKVKETFNQQIPDISQGLIEFYSFGSQEWWVAKTPLLKDSLKNYIKHYYGTSLNHPIISKALNTKIVKQSKKEAFQNQTKNIIDTLSSFYVDQLNNQYWISESTYSYGNDSIDQIIFSKYGTNSDSLIDVAINSKRFVSYKKEFNKKYHNQANQFISVQNFLKSDDKDNYKIKDLEVKSGNRYLFNMYIAKDHTDYAVYTLQPMLVGYSLFKTNGEEIFIYNSRKSENDYLKNYESVSHPENSNYRIHCFDIEGKDYSSYMDSELLMIGDYTGYGDPVYDYLSEDWTRIIQFDNCEIIGIYKNLEYTKGGIDIWSEYNKYLKDKIGVSDIPEINNNLSNQNNKSKSTKSIKTKTIQNKISNGEISSKCEIFLEEYEQFMDDYIVIIKKYKSNPTDISILSDYTIMVTKVSEWRNLNEECVNNPSFMGKYTEIQMKIANSVSDL